MSGDEWQEWANSILRLHYGPTDYQSIPDKHKGDAGIEGFSISKGHAYQAYGCEEPIGVRERYEAQRDKMTRDIKKFITNSAILKELFGSVTIRRWVLFVPVADSRDLISHASAKTREVLAAELPYVAPDFRIVVCQENDFKQELGMLLGLTSDALSISVESPTSEQIADWAASNDALALRLANKLRKMPTLASLEERERFQAKVLRWHLEGEAILDALKSYPEVYQKVLAAKAHRENYLVDVAIGESPKQMFASAIEQLKVAFDEEVRVLHRYSAEALVYGTVAEWLLRCPLDFPEAHANGS